jgi:signal transduction histidine kinase
VRGGEAKDEADTVVWNRRGEPIRARVSLRPLVDGRELRGAVLTISDLTQIREAEEALRRAVAAREETMAVVSHDLRNPLSSVSAAAELLLEVPLPEDRRRQQLEGVRRAAHRMHRLISDLLDVARIDAGGLSVRVSPVEVASLVEEAVVLIHPRAREAGIDVATEVDPDVSRVAGDRDRLLQVLGNLLGNAVRHTPAQGRIEVSARHHGGEEVCITVSDTGPGIPPEDRPHLFDRFWRRDRAESEGAGLGLAIVRGIVAAHGGRVEVDPEAALGATFRVHLPRAEPSADGDEAADEWAARPTLRLSRREPPATGGDG